MCDNQVVAMYRKDGFEVFVQCGSYFGDKGKLLCTFCEVKAKQEYPQGWKYYPGDTCRHGTYVGGCGRDLMCGACEMGD